MTAQRIVDALIETDFDPKELANRATSPNLEVLQAELLERDWTHVHLMPGDDNRWTLTAEVIDYAHRAKWMGYGARVAPTPDAEPMAMNIHRTLKTCLRKAGVRAENIKIESMRPNHEGVDLAAQVDDPSEVRGDWYVVIEFDYDPVM